LTRGYLIKFFFFKKNKNIYIKKKKKRRRENPGVAGTTPKGGLVKDESVKDKLKPPDHNLDGIYTNENDKSGRAWALFQNREEERRNIVRLREKKIKEKVIL
jgi:hypothetical protein